MTTELISTKLTFRTWTAFWKLSEPTLELLSNMIRKSTGVLSLNSRNSPSSVKLAGTKNRFQDLG